jgi:hypothetical protein
MAANYWPVEERARGDAYLSRLSTNQIVQLSQALQR